MEEKKASTLFEEMKDDISSYVLNTISLTKLEAYEKIAKGSSIIAYSAVVLCMSLFTILLILVTAALYLGDLLQNMWIGFGIVSLFTLFILLIFALLGKKIKSNLVNRVVTFLMDRHDDNKG